MSVIMDTSSRRSDSRSNSSDVERTPLAYSFVIQTCSNYNPRSNLPWRNSKLYLYRTLRMGVTPGDFHGEWWREGERLYLAYNYRGVVGLENAVTVYCPISSTSCWMTAPPNLQPSGWTPNISVLIPFWDAGNEPIPCNPASPAKRHRGEG